jgi:hypothetical protein
LVEDIIVNRFSRKERQPSVHENWNHIQHILVKHVRYQVRISTVSLSTMAK